MVIGQNDLPKFFGYQLLVKTTTSNFSVIGYWSEQPPQIFQLLVISVLNETVNAS